MTPNEPLVESFIHHALKGQDGVYVTRQYTAVAKDTLKVLEITIPEQCQNHWDAGGISEGPHGSEIVEKAEVEPAYGFGACVDNFQRVAASARLGVIEFKPGLGLYHCQ